MNFAKASYSVNKGLWGTSVGGKETLSSNGMLPEEAWPTQVSATTPQQVILGFEKGELVKVNNNSFKHPTDAILFLQNIAGPYGIGRDIHIGDTIIGIKGRVGFEAAAPVIIIKAHHTLEKHVLTKMATELERPAIKFLRQLAARRANTRPRDAQHRSFFSKHTAICFGQCICAANALSLPGYRH